MKQSLRVILSIAMALMILICAVFSIAYSVELYNSTVVQIAGNSTPALHAVSTTALSNLSSAESYMVNIVYDSDIMGYLGVKEDPTGVYDAENRLRDAYITLINADETITGFFICDKRTGINHAIYGHLSGRSGPERIAQKEQIQNALLPKLQENELNLLDWDFFQAGETTMMYRAIYWAGCYTICLVDLSGMVSHYTDRYNLSGHLVLAKDGRCLTDNGGYDLALDNTQLVADSAYLNRDARTLIVEKASRYLDFYNILPLDTLVNKVSTLQLMILGTSLLCMVGLCVVFVYLRRQFVLPMSSLMTSMERIRAGDLDAQPSARSNTTEFRALNETFNSMITSLRNAKILAYEKDLENQQIRFNSLRLQIRPHFYLNCLKCIYASAALEDTETVRSQILYLSTHLRYCFSDLGTAVPLSQELEMCRNYTSMLSLNQQTPLYLRLDVDESLRSFAIPPMTILTAVENAAKYFRQTGGTNTCLVITISAHALPMEGGRLVNITIQDNGPGFSDDAMRLIQNPSTDHVGISNIIQQLRLYFGEGCEVSFSNHSGARVDYFIPIEEDAHEPSDC